jgi:hypothetical protein
MKAEDPSPCVTVNCKLWKSTIALYLNPLRKLVTKVLINPIIRTRTRHFRHAYHPTRDHIYHESPYAICRTPGSEPLG